MPAAELQNGTYTGYNAYIASVEAVDGKVVIKAQLTEDGKPANPLQVYNFLSATYIVPEGLD